MAVVWYERAASLTDANITAMAFFKALGGAAEHTAAARLASAEGDLRDVILRFLPDGPRVSVPFDADGQAKAAARGVPPEGTDIAEVWSPPRVQGGPRVHIPPCGAAQAPP